MRTSSVRHSLFLSLFVVPLVGCVSLGTHEELQQQHAELKERYAGAQLDVASKDKELAASRKKGVDLESALNNEKQRSADLDAQMKELDARTKTAEAQLRTELQQTQGELANVIKDRSALKGSVDEMKKALDELARRKAEADKRIAEYKGLLARFKALIDAGKLRVKIVDGRMVVQLSSDILFASGSAGLSKDGKASIVEVAKVLATIPDRKFQVEGHTDNVPIKTEQFPSNWELASARALNVVRAMTDAGMPPERVSAASFADTKPAASNDTSEGKTQNRRIEIVVVPDLSQLPGFDELQKVGS